MDVHEDEDKSVANVLILDVLLFVDCRLEEFNVEVEMGVEVGSGSLSTVTHMVTGVFAVTAGLEDGNDLLIMLTLELEELDVEMLRSEELGVVGCTKVLLGAIELDAET